MSLEDILNEYSPEPENNGSTEPPDDTSDSDKTRHRKKKSSTTAAFARPAEGEESGQEEASGEAEQRRTRVSFLQSGAADMPMRVNVPSRKEKTAVQEHEQQFMGDAPKIRRMSDSTQAKEIAKRKKNKKKKNKKSSDAPDALYATQRIEGEYVYTQIRHPKRNRTRKKVNERPTEVTALGMETLRFSTVDVVPVAQPPEPEPVQPIEVEPAPRAEKTTMNLSSVDAIENAEDLDVVIARSKEEAAEETRRQQKLSEEMELENVADIRSDIRNLKSAIRYRIAALVLVLIVSTYISICCLTGIRTLLGLTDWFVALIQTILGIAAGSVCFPMMKNGIKRLISFHADTDSMAAVSLIGCTLASFAVALPLGQPENTPLYMPCAILVLLLHTVGKLLCVNREENNLKLATKHFDCYGLRIVDSEQNADALTRGVLTDFPVVAAIRHTKSLVDFRKYTYSADIADRFCRHAAPILLGFSVLTSLGVTLLRAESIVYGLMLFSMMAASCGCAAITFVANLPLFKATTRMVKNGGLLMGYQGVDDFYDANAVMVDAASMFPDGYVKINNVKMFSTVKVKETLLTAASLARHTGSVFGNMFRDTFQGNEDVLYPVEDYIYEDGMGMCGWIRNQRVLLGNRELMASHNIEGIPSKSKEAELQGEAIYLSISGNLSAVFSVELTADPKVKYWADRLARNNVNLLIHSIDPMITQQKIAKVFGIPQENVRILPSRNFLEYRIETEPVERMGASAACSGSFSGVAQLLVGAKTIRRSAGIGIVIQALSILIGVGIALLEALLEVGMTPLWMLIIQCVAAAFTILAGNIRRP